jgi:hypothetical protein
MLFRFFKRLSSSSSSSIPTFSPSTLKLSPSLSLQDKEIISSSSSIYGTGYQLIDRLEVN